MIPKTYSPENLRKLMAESPGYKSTTPEAKANIEKHIKQNNEAVLLYIFQELREEALSIEASRQKLANNVASFAEEESEELGKKLKDNLNK